MQDEFIRLQQMLKKTIVFITHDFEEATKLADRIGIMKDGQMVQLCTPEEMVLNPADDYVAAFAQNAPRDRIVSAAAIMEKTKLKTPRKVTGACVPASAKIGTIAEQVIGSDKPTPVTDKDGYLLGHVDRERITKALFGKGKIV